VRLLRRVDQASGPAAVANDETANRMGMRRIEFARWRPSWRRSRVNPPRTMMVRRADDLATGFTDSLPDDNSSVAYSEEDSDED
jgi:hypothetical protein